MAVSAELRFDAERFEAFFALLPRDTDAAAALARQHDGRVAGPVVTAAHARVLRHAIEIRHPSFVDPAFIALLRRQHVALVVADTAGRWPLLEDLSADFVYLRLHGDQEIYASGYTATALDTWAARIDAWRDGGQPDDARLAAPDDRPPARRGRDVYVYFDNDIKVHAPYDAAHLSQRLGVATAIGADDRFAMRPICSRAAVAAVRNGNGGGKVSNRRRCAQGRPIPARCLWSSGAMGQN